MNNKNQWKLGLLVANLFPLVGVFEQKWSFFIVLYIYWFETLIHSCFNAIKIISTPKYEGKIRKSLIYFITRFGIFIFYTIFLIVFIGIINQSDEVKTENLVAIGFGNKLVNIALLNFFVFNLFDYIFNFRLTLSSEEKLKTVTKYIGIFDTRTIIIHIVIILSAIIYSFVYSKVTNSKLIVNIILFTLFIGIKSLVDWFSNVVTEHISN